MTKNGMGWRIVTIARIRFKTQLTGTPRSSSLYDWSVLKMWLFSDAPDYAADNPVRQMNGANVLRSNKLNYRTMDRDIPPVVLQYCG